MAYHTAPGGTAAAVREDGDPGDCGGTFVFLFVGLVSQDRMDTWSCCSSCH